MNKRMIVWLLGALLLIESGLMLLPLVTALLYRERTGLYFLYTILGAAAAGGLMMLVTRPKNKTIYARDGLMTVALSWIVLSLVGAVPFTLSREIPSYLDAVFEMISGFTTTGSSILPDVEALSHCMLFWRSFSHWIGGMGILVFMMAILRLEGGQGIHLLRAESPGPAVAKMVPRMADSSKILYTIYLALTVIQILFYLAGGMPVFDALCNTFGTAGTGGLAIKRDSFLSYSYYAQTVTTVFMALFGVNFSIYFFLLRRKFDLVWKNTELRWYLGLIFGAIAVITVNTLSYYPRVYDAFPSRGVRRQLHHHDNGLRHGGLQPLAGAVARDFGVFDDHRRVRRVDRRRPEGLAAHYPLPRGPRGDPSSAPSAHRQGHADGRQAHLPREHPLRQHVPHSVRVSGDGVGAARVAG